MNTSTAVELFLTAKRGEHASPKTIDFYTIYLTRFTQIHGQKEITTLSTHMVRRFLSHLESPHVARACYSSLLAFCNWLELEPGVQFTNPFYNGRVKAIKRPKTPKSAPRRTSPDAVKEVLESIQIWNWVDARDKAILALLRATAIRVSELCKLQMDDLHLLEKVINVDGKGAVERETPFSQAAAFWLFAYLSGRPQTSCPYVFLSNLHGARRTRRTYGALTPSGVRQMIARRCRAAGVPVFTPHSIRHGTATALLNVGFDIAFVQRLLGHSNPSVTKAIYAQWTDEGFRKLYAETKKELDI